EYPADETVLIQGIIDAFFIEDGKIVIVDYKTDHVKTPEELTKRYRIQLDYYGEALGNMLKMEVGAKILWSFALEKEIML
ncbi:MAG: PD-(D/E)XK nuclease family protein, partial [Lachnospiraceae bacterium]